MPSSPPPEPTLRELAEWILRSVAVVDAVPQTLSALEFQNALVGLKQLRGDFAAACSPEAILAMLDDVDALRARLDAAERELERAIKRMTERDIALDAAEQSLSEIGDELTRWADDSIAYESPVQGVKLLAEIARDHATARDDAERDTVVRGLLAENKQLHDRLDANEFVAFIGGGNNHRGAFPKNLTELNADCQEFAARSSDGADNA